MSNYWKAAVLVLGVMCVAAVSGFAADKSGRYELKQTNDGFIRLDTQTGSVAHCAQSNGKWQCENLEGDYGNGQPDVARLVEQNNSLRDRITRLETQVQNLTSGKTTPRSKLELPSDDELDQIMGFFEKLVTRFRQIVRTLQGTPSGEDI